MATVKQVSVGASYTKNLGNFQSLKVEASIVVELHNDDDAEAVYADAWERVQKQVRVGLGRSDQSEQHHTNQQKGSLQPASANV